MQVRLLGPVDVAADDGPRPVHGLRRMAVLATLALHCGEVVSTGRLADVVWGQAAPVTAVNTLQSHVSFLRHVLGSKAAIRARPPGYVLDLAGDGTDVRLAERLFRQGRQSADPARGALRLQDALALWRGRPLADLAGLPWMEEQAERLDLLYVQVKQAWFEARLASGEHVALVPELEQMVADRPLDEHLRALLMLALYRSGRQTDALAAFQQMRRTIVAELGADPGRELRDLETAILRQDPALDPPTPPAGPARALPRMPVPAQLPPAVAAFAGRGAELASLDALLPAAAQAGPGRDAAAVMVVLSGTAGVGKTALAVHWAHQMAAQFPDGQLYVNLQGFDPDGTVLEPSEAVRGFLEAFGVPAARIPAALVAQAALFRSLLAGRRVLIVLDNARDAAQVRPLLPGSPRLPGHRDQPRPARRPGRHGLRASADPGPAVRGRCPRPARPPPGIGPGGREPAAVDDIIAGCARLPLALTIAAARAATSPGFPLSRATPTELRGAAARSGPLAGTVISPPTSGRCSPGPTAR